MSSPGSVLELAHPPKLFALHASREVGVALNLLLPAGDACNRQPLARLPRLGNAPVGVDRLAIYHRLAVTAVIVLVAETLPWYLDRSDESWEEVRACPDLGPQTVLDRDGIRDIGAGRRRGHVRSAVTGSVLRVSVETVVPGSWKWHMMQRFLRRVFHRIPTG
jgi:hypothetical protein